jgi:hypothetical protein
VLDFPTRSSPNITWDAASGLLRHMKYDNNKHHAISAALPLDRETSWRISVQSLVGGNDLLLGVIGCDVGVNSILHKQSICWNLSGKNVFSKGGAEPSTDGWTGGGAGDVLTFTYKPSTSTISVHVRRTGLTHSSSTEGLPAVHIHCILFCVTKLHITML